MYTVEQIQQMVVSKEQEVRALAQYGVVLSEEQIRETLRVFEQQLVQEGVLDPQYGAQEGDVQVTPVQPQPQAPVQHFEYSEITDLYLPDVDAVTKAQAIELANKIEMLNISITERVNRGVIVPDAEIKSLNNMIKSFNKMTRKDYYHVITGKVKRGASAMIDFTFGTVVGELDDRTQKFVENIEDTTCNLIDGAGKLASSTVEFASNFAQGMVRLSGGAIRGSLKTTFGLFRK